MFEEINNHHENESTDILESDEVLSEKKFVLKLDKKKKTKSVSSSRRTNGRTSS